MSEGSIDHRSQDGLRVITINRPAKRNAMTADMCDQLRAAWLAFRDSPDRVAVLRGEGGVFTAGADLSSPPPRFWQAVPGLGVDIGKPVIAAVHGPVVGLGVTLVAFCDLCVASTEARFIYPEARVGVAAGAIASIAARIPHKIAMELMLLGEPIAAQRAYEAGLVNRVAEPGRELEVALELARSAARGAPLVLKFLQRMTAETLPRSPIEAMYRAQAQADTVAQSEDAQEGLRAFAERRPPRFEGR